MYSEETLLPCDRSYFLTLKLTAVLSDTFTDHNQTLCGKCKFPISLENQPGKKL